MRNKKQKHFWGSFFVIGYVSALSFIGVVGHNHLVDGSLHDNCPACQWDMQTKAEDNTAKVILEVIRSHLIRNEFVPFEHIFLIKQDYSCVLIQERAPPAS